MVEIRDTVRELIAMQMEESVTDEEIHKQQEKLNQVYDAYTAKYWVAQFSFGFYSLMLTSLLLGLIVMVLYKPRTWCTFCPMGTMTQGICKLKNNEKK